MNVYGTPVLSRNLRSCEREKAGPRKLPFCESVH